MTKFINKKEEVIQIELTPRGKTLFSQGSFSPEFYSFFDDDIMYDGACGGVVEIQNEIVQRIKNTERTSVIGNTGLKNPLEAQTVDATTVANVKFLRPLGNNSPWSDNAPAWNIASVGSSCGFSGSAANKLLEYKANSAIPTLTSGLEIQYEDLVDEDAGDQAPPLPILVKNDTLILDILEMNTIFKGNSNYDIEVFRIPNPEQEPDRLERLNFINRYSPDSGMLFAQSQDPSIFVDPATSLGLSEDFVEQEFPRLDETYVEYYLNVRVDSEIQDAPPIRSTVAYASGRPDDPAQICQDRTQTPAGWDRT